MILTREVAQKKIERMALQVAENNYDKDDLLLIGIKENGIHIAEQLAGYLQKIFKGKIEIISLALDKKKPAEITLSKEVDCNGRHIILVDDVANSGKTMLYALKPLLAYYPAQLETLALVERTHKQFPLAINYCGISVSTTSQQNIVVEVEEGVVTGAYLK